MTEPKTLLFRMTIEQANYVLELLGEQPYVKVHGLINQMQTQARQQLDKPDPSDQVLDAFAGMGGGGDEKVIDQAG